jgi:hypothetical protein
VLRDDGALYSSLQRNSTKRVGQIVPLVQNGAAQFSSPRSKAREPHKDCGGQSAKVGHFVPLFATWKVLSYVGTVPLSHYSGLCDICVCDFLCETFPPRKHKCPCAHSSRNRNSSGIKHLSGRSRNRGYFLSRNSLGTPRPHL